MSPSPCAPPVPAVRRQPQPRPTPSTRIARARCPCTTRALVSRRDTLWRGAVRRPYLTNTHGVRRPRAGTTPVGLESRDRSELEVGHRRRRSLAELRAGQIRTVLVVGTVVVPMTNGDRSCPRFTPSLPVVRTELVDGADSTMGEPAS